MTHVFIFHYPNIFSETYKNLKFFLVYYIERKVDELYL